MAHRRLLLATATRAKALVTDRIAALVKSDPDRRAGQRATIIDDWASPSGPLGRPRTWAMARLMQAESSL